MYDHDIIIIPFSVHEENTFRIVTSFGYVHNYGLFEGLDLLNLTNDLSAVCFRLLSNDALQDIVTKKCLHRLTPTNRQLVLKECNGPIPDTWEYNSTSEYLMDLTMGQGWCLSPWVYDLPPPDISYVPGVSPCGIWNYITLQPC